MAACLFCQAELPENAAFCPACGKKQVVRYTQTFRRGSMKEEDFIAQINAWFAQYPQVANVKGEFLLGHGVGLLVNKYTLDALSIEYEVFSGQNTNQYAVVQLSEFGFTHKETADLLAKWKAANPAATVIRTAGGVNQRGSTGSLMMGGLGAKNKAQLYVLFKFDRKQGTAQP